VNLHTDKFKSGNELLFVLQPVGENSGNGFNAAPALAGHRCFRVTGNEKQKPFTMSYTRAATTGAEFIEQPKRGVDFSLFVQGLKVEVKASDELVAVKGIKLVVLQAQQVPLKNQQLFFLAGGLIGSGDVWRHGKQKILV